MRNESKIAKKFPPLGDFEVGWPKWGSGQRYVRGVGDKPLIIGTKESDYY
jgi:hypothetical protein